MNFREYLLNEKEQQTVYIIYDDIQALLDEYIDDWEKIPEIYEFNYDFVHTTKKMSDTIKKYFEKHKDEYDIEEDIEITTKRPRSAGKAPDIAIDLYKDLKYLTNSKFSKKILKNSQPLTLVSTPSGKVKLITRTREYSVNQGKNLLNTPSMLVDKIKNLGVDITLQSRTK